MGLFCQFSKSISEFFIRKIRFSSSFLLLTVSLPFFLLSSTVAKAEYSAIQCEGFLDFFECTQVDYISIFGDAATLSVPFFVDSHGELLGFKLKVHLVNNVSCEVFAESQFGSNKSFTFEVSNTNCFEFTHSSLNELEDIMLANIRSLTTVSLDLLHIYKVSSGYKYTLQETIPKLQLHTSAINIRQEHHSFFRHSDKNIKQSFSSDYSLS